MSSNNQRGGPAKKAGSVGNIAHGMSKMSISKSTNETKEERKARQQTERKQRNAARQERLTKQKEKYEKWAKAGENICKFPKDRINPKGNVIKGNFFKVEFTGTAQFRLYRIELGKIDDEEPMNKNLRRKLIEILLERYPPSAKTWASDYFSTIVSVEKLYKENVDNQVPFPRPHPRHTASDSDHSQGQSSVAPEPDLESKIFFEGGINFSELKKLISQDKVPDTYHPDRHLNILNIISWSKINKPDWQGVRVGNKFFPKTAQKMDIDRTVPLSPGAPKNTQPQTYWVYEGRTGFVTSMRPADGQLLLNVSVTTSAFYRDMNLQHWIQNRWNLEDGQFPGDTKVFNEIRGLKVTFALLNPERQWRICEVSKETVSLQGFEKDGTSISVFDYMNTKYGNSELVKKSYGGLCKHAFCVNLGNPKDPIWHPADWLTIVRDQVVTAKLDPHFTDKMVKAAERRPGQNEEAVLSHALTPLGINPPESFLNQFGLRIENKMVLMKARYLKQPIIKFKNKDIDIGGGAKTKVAHGKSVAFWDVAAAQFCSVPNAQHRTIHIIHINGVGGPNNAAVQRFRETLPVALAKYGLGINKPKVYVLDITKTFVDDPMKRRNKWIAELNKADAQLKSPSLIVILLSSEDAGAYSNIKRWADCVKGVPTVCVSPSALQKNLEAKDWNRNPSKSGDPRLLGNLCMKINFKLGGINHVLPAEDGLWFGAFKETMVVGADVTHSTKAGEADKKYPSLAGVVATYDGSGYYLASARLQESGTEFIAKLASMIQERVVHYHKRWTKIPEHILFYRDGVSKSQYGMVYLEELPLIRDGCKYAIDELKLPADTPHPKITLLVVGKRHHTRFLPYFDDKQQKMPQGWFPGNKKLDKNLPPGLIIDHTVVNAHQFSFYLQSHDSPQGTARSGHYVVIINESNYSVEKLQEVTHNICFTGSRATSSLSVCTPARYADLLCTRLRCYMRPVLEETRDAPSQTLEQLQKNTDVWRCPVQPATIRWENPWISASQIGNRMFYL